MDQVEDRQFSWITGFYWTLTVMSTLGFGDITFHSDLGRLFSVLVLLSGIFLLLIVLPFTFIRFFYAPWLEAQVRVRAPRVLPGEVRDHVILCAWDTIAPGPGDPPGGPRHPLRGAGGGPGAGGPDEGGGNPGGDGRSG
jgi:voltage-gated potassium channel